jgi:DNA-binding CsgD family transcriptional regulator
MRCLCDSQHLTPREIDIVVRCAIGMNAAQIASALHISPRTVEYYIACILKRADATNITAAVARCYATGVLITYEWPPRWSGQLCLPRPEEFVKVVGQMRLPTGSSSEGSAVLPTPGARPSVVIK